MLLEILNYAGKLYIYMLYTIWYNVYGCKINTIQAKIILHIRSIVTMDDEKFYQTLNMNDNIKKMPIIIQVEQKCTYKNSMFENNS